jgi:hypothetical protein
VHDPPEATVAPTHVLRSERRTRLILLSIQHGHTARGAENRDAPSPNSSTRRNLK